MKTINPLDIKPKVRGQSDFFSWQLYRWVKEKPNALKIWTGTWNDCTGIDPEKPVFYIGSERDEEGYIHGKQLRNLCSYGASLDGWAYGPSLDTKNWVDVTDQFWSDYMQTGVCAIHGDYAHSWIEEGKTRTCEYCGTTQKQMTKLIEKIEWINA